MLPCQVTYIPDASVGGGVFPIGDSGDSGSPVFVYSRSLTRIKSASLWYALGWFSGAKVF